jgi:hypothetical protein
MDIKNMIKNKKKLISISLEILFLLGVCVFGIVSIYKNYQEKQIQQEIKQHKNEQIEQAKEKVKKIVDGKMSGMKCEVKYDLKNASDNNLTIAVAFDDNKSTTVNCDFKRTDNSIDFNDESSFNSALDKFISQEKEAEIRHTIIYDYQDILYGMRGKMSDVWDKVKFSKNDDDYVVQETSDRFFGGNKAYLVIIDSQWIKKNGGIEWKDICLHMEYDKNNKLINASYDYNHDPDPDKDIKNTSKYDENILNKEDKSEMTISQNQAIEIVKKTNDIDETVSSVTGNTDFDKTLDGIKYYEVEVTPKGGHGASSTYYVNSKSKEIISLVNKEELFNRIQRSK